ncbi:MAG: hypothetical protein ACO2ON_01195 [Candidatus Nanopusillus sp.]
MVYKVVVDLIKAAEKHLENVERIELDLAGRRVLGNPEISREISREIGEVKKYVQLIKNIDKEFNEIDKKFKEIMGGCTNKYHKLLEELKRNRLENTDLYRRVKKIHDICEFLHKNGLGSDKLFYEGVSIISSESTNIKREIGSIITSGKLNRYVINKNLIDDIKKIFGEINTEVSKNLEIQVTNKIVEIDNNIKNLIDRIKKIYGHIKNYENIYKNIAKAEKDLHEEIVKLEKLHGEIRPLGAALANLEKYIALRH